MYILPFVSPPLATQTVSQEETEVNEGITIWEIIQYICFHYELDGVQYLDDLGGEQKREYNGNNARRLDIDMYMHVENYYDFITHFNNNQNILLKNNLYFYMFISFSLTLARKGKSLNLVPPILWRKE